MPKRFYAAWAFAVMLAAVLPIAIPYFIWTTDPGPAPVGAGAAEIFGRYAQSKVRLTTYVPSSVSVSGTPFEDGARRACAKPPIRSELNYSATVRLHGAYGIPFSSTRVDCDGGPIGGVPAGGRLFLPGFAWLLGIVIVSTPFVLALYRRDAESRADDAGPRRHDLRQPH